MTSSAAPHVHNGQSASATGPDRAAAPPQPGQDGRDAGGRFARGNRGGPGSPFARQTARRMQILREEFSEERLREAATMIYLKAIGGDLAAAKIMFAYGAARPPAAVDPDRLHIDEFKVFEQAATDGQAMKTVINSLPVERANEVFRAAVPAIGDDMMGLLGQAMEAPDPKKAMRQERKARWKAERRRRIAERRAECARRESPEQRAESREPSPNREIREPSANRRESPEQRAGSREPSPNREIRESANRVIGDRAAPSAKDENGWPAEGHDGDGSDWPSPNGSREVGP